MNCRADVQSAHGAKGARQSATRAVQVSQLAKNAQCGALGRVRFDPPHAERKCKDEDQIKRHHLPPVGWTHRIKNTATQPPFLQR